MKVVFRLDSKDYEDFTEILSFVENSDYVIDVSLKHNDDSVYSLSGISGSPYLKFENVLSGADLFNVSGTVLSQGSGILRFDLSGIFDSKGSNVYRTMVNFNDITNSRAYNVYTGRLVIVDEL